MSNINRRDYLKGMAATAGVIAASKLEVFGQRSRRRGRRQATRKSEDVRPGVVPSPDPSIVNWKITPNRPSSTEFVTAIFSGLMGFSYDPQADEGRVGFHGHAGHKLTVRVHRVSDCSKPPEKQPLSTTVTRAKHITLKVIPDWNRPVDYFENDPKLPFDRLNGDLRDFRWLPDLEGADFYPEGYDKYKDHFKTWLHVKNATFYTYLRGSSRFNLVTRKTNSSPWLLLKHFGHVARYMAAAIDVSNANQSVMLQIDDNPPFRFDNDGNEKYQIVFINECDSCPPAAPCGNEETRWNDFHHARDVMKLPGGRLKIGLKLDPSPPINPVYPVPPLFCELPHVSSADPCNIARATDEAPCMGAGYGNDRL